MEDAKKPYTVEVDAIGCGECGAGGTWTVVGPDEVAVGISFVDEGEAEDLADYMNIAYDAGWKEREELP